MLDTVKKILSIALGLLLFPLITILSALVHVIGFACLILAGALLFPSIVSSISVLQDLYTNSQTETSHLNTPFLTYLKRDLTLRLFILGVGSLGLALYSIAQVVLILRSPFEGIKAGFNQDIDGVFSGIKHKLFNPFSINLFINQIIQQNPEFLGILNSIAQNRGVNLDQLAHSEDKLTPQEINQLTYRLPSPDAAGYRDAVTSWESKLNTIENAQCSISLVIPEQQDIILLQHQYYHNQAWHPLLNETYVFSKQDLTEHLTTRNALNPNNRANVRDTTSKHTHQDEACDTRWRIIPFCDQDATLCQTLQTLHDETPAAESEDDTQPVRHAQPVPEVASAGQQLFRLFTNLNPLRFTEAPPPADDARHHPNLL